MKRIILCLFIVLLLTHNSGAQIYEGYAVYMMQFNQPNARSEALGWGNAVLTGSPFMSIYNPASSSFSKGISAEISNLTLNFPVSLSAGYSAYGASASLGRIGSVSLNYLRFSWNEPFYITTPQSPIGAGKFEPSTNIYVLNYSYMILNGLSAGLNVNYFDDKFPSASINGWMVDAGLLKKFVLNEAGAAQNLYLGLSASNITNSKMELNSAQYDYYPSILRAAAGFEYEHAADVSGFRIFKALIMSEYYDMLNSRYYTRAQFGTEVTLLEMIKLRGSWFTEERNNYGNKENISRLEKFTYGFGIELPLIKIIGSSLPVNLKLDHASLAFPKYNSRINKTANCPVYTVSAAYEF